MSIIKRCKRISRSTPEHHHIALTDEFLEYYPPKNLEAQKLSTKSSKSEKIKKLGERLPQDLLQMGLGWDGNI